MLDKAGVSAETPLVVGVSGGADSLTLLHAILQQRAPAHLIVAHLHHGMRASADDDATAVERVAREWGVRCIVGYADVPALAQEAGQSLEAAARNARYRFLAKTADGVEAAHVAVGHTADDQAETVLLHLIRGSGLRGLRGMTADGPWPMAGHDRLRLLRPLLAVRRAEVEAYCASHALRPVDDHTNRDTRFRRNFVRHEVLPLLRTVNPQLTTRLVDLADVVSAELAMLDAFEEEAWRQTVRAQNAQFVIFNGDQWRGLPLGMRRRLLRRAIAVLQPDATDVTLKPVDAALTLAQSGSVGTQAHLPGPVMLEVGYGTISMRAPGAALPASGPQLLDAQPVALPVPGSVALRGGMQLSATPVDAGLSSRVGELSSRWSVFVEMAQDDVLWVRPRRVGERMQPLGMYGHSRKLQDVMVDARIPAAERALWPVVATAQRVVWVVGARLDARAAVSAEAQPSSQLVNLVYGPI